MKARSFGIVATLCALCLVITFIHPAQAAGSKVMVNNGQYMEYTGSASAAYQMYAASNKTGDDTYTLYITITNNQTYPVRGTLYYLSTQSMTSSRTCEINTIDKTTVAK